MTRWAHPIELASSCARQATFCQRAKEGSRAAPYPSSKSTLEEGGDLPVEHVRSLAHQEVARVPYWHVFQIQVELRSEIGPVDEDAGVALTPQDQRRNV